MKNTGDGKTGAKWSLGSKARDALQVSLRKGQELARKIASVDGRKLRSGGEVGMNEDDSDGDLESESGDEGDEEELQRLADDLVWQAFTLHDLRSLSYRLSLPFPGKRTKLGGERKTQSPNGIKVHAESC